MSNSKATLLAMIPVAVFIFLVVGLLQCDFVTVDAAAFQKEKEYTYDREQIIANFKGLILPTRTLIQSV